jgi:hypothetical protein
MNEHSSALRATVIGRAAPAIEAAKLQVIDRDWQSGEHRLDFVATPGDGILAAVAVWAVAYGILGACISATSEDRIRRPTAAAREWMRGHDADYDDLWLASAARERAALRLTGTPWQVNAEIPRDEPLRRFMPGGGGWEPIARDRRRPCERFRGGGFAAGRVDLRRPEGTLMPTRGDCTAPSDSGWERCDEYDRHR